MPIKTKLAKLEKTPNIGNAHFRVTGFEHHRHIATQIFYDSGRLYCSMWASHRADHKQVLPDGIEIPWDFSDCAHYCDPHQGKPLLFIQENGKVTASPLAGSLVFVRLPDNSMKCFSYETKPALADQEIREAVCVCGVCWKRDKDREKELKKKKELIDAHRMGYTRIFYVGIESMRDSDYHNSLSQRANEWFLRMGRGVIKDTRKNFIAWMLHGPDGFTGEDRRSVDQDAELQMKWALTERPPDPIM